MTETIKKITMNDIFKYEKEAFLLAKMQSKDEDFKNTLSRLRQDMRRAFETYYAYSNRRFRHARPEDNDHAYATCWELSIDEFCDLTAYYKAFGIATRDSMRELLLKERRRVAAMQQIDKNRFLKRGKRGACNDEVQEISCVNENRLTPLDNTSYGNYAFVLALKRLRNIALENTPCNTNSWESRVWKNADSITYLTPVITENSIAFFLGGEQVKNHEEWVGVYNRVNPDRDIRTPSVLSKMLEGIDDEKEYGLIP